MNILITGGSGFIGTNLVSDLLKDGHNVLIYDKSRSETYPDFCIVADIRDKDKLVNSLSEIDVVYHLAAEHRDDVHPASLYYDVNVRGAKNVVYAAEKNYVNKLIFTSSVAVYGLNAGEPNEESPVKPFNDYGWSKYKSEIVFNEWVKNDSSNCLVIVRPTVIFGEGNRGNVYNLIRQVATGRFIMVGSGKNKKSMGYAHNITRFLSNILHSNPGRHIYNYADNPGLNMNELVRIAMTALGKDHEKIVRVPYFLGLLGGYSFDLLFKITKRTYPISSIRIKKFCAGTPVSTEKLKEIGFNAPYSLSEGLNRMISKEFMQNYETSKGF